MENMDTLSLKSIFRHCGSLILMLIVICVKAVNDSPCCQKLTQNLVNLDKIQKNREILFIPQHRRKTSIFKSCFIVLKCKLFVLHDDIKLEDNNQTGLLDLIKLIRVVAVVIIFNILLASPNHKLLETHWTMFLLDKRTFHSDHFCDTCKISENRKQLISALHLTSYLFVFCFTWWASCCFQYVFKLFSI